MDVSKITNASNIMLGNKQVKKLYIGSNLVWSPNQEEQQFDLLPIVMDSDAQIRLSYSDLYQTIGNSTFIMKPLNPIKLSDVDIIYNTQYKVAIQKIDDYALYISRITSHNYWSGGNTIGPFEETTTLRYKNQEKEITFKGKLDENNKTFMGGMYVNKVLKVPSIGCNNEILKVRFFPYTFDDKFYSMTSFPLYLVDYNDTSNSRKNYYLFDNEAKTFTNTRTNNVINLNDTIFSNLNVSYSGLQGIIEYSIKQNNTNEFRDIVLYTYDSLVHFVQEPHNERRIYIGLNTSRVSESEYLEKGNDNGEYMFHMYGSKILNGPFQIDCGYTTDVLYPEALENEYYITYVKTLNRDEKRYTWDNIVYKRCSATRFSKIIFNKK